jgi:hypothetical protein
LDPKKNLREGLPSSKMSNAKGSRSTVSTEPQGRGIESLEFSDVRNSRLFMQTVLVYVSAAHSIPLGFIDRKS